MLLRTIPANNSRRTIKRKRYLKSKKMARNLKKLKDNIVTITDYSQNEFEKF